MDNQIIDTKYENLHYLYDDNRLSVYFSPHDNFNENMKFITCNEFNIYCLNKNIKRMLLEISFLIRCTIDKVNIEVFTNKKCFDEFKMSSNKIATFIPSEDNTYYLENITEVIIREYINIYCKKIITNDARWIKEGLPLYFIYKYAKYINIKKYMIIKMLNSHFTVPNIEALYSKDENVFKTQTYNGYAISFMIIHYLINHHENVDLLELLNNSEKAKEFATELLKNRYEVLVSSLNINLDYINESSIKCPEDILKYMEFNYIYGWQDINGEKHYHTAKGVKELYRVNNIETIKETKIGTCAEQSKIIKYYLEKMGYQCAILCQKNKINSISERIHCICIYKSYNKWNMVDVSISSTIKESKILSFESIEEMINYIKKISTYNSEYVVVPDIPDGLTYDELLNYLDENIVKKEYSRKRK